MNNQHLNYRNLRLEVTVGKGTNPQCFDQNRFTDQGFQVFDALSKTITAVGKGINPQYFDQTSITNQDFEFFDDLFKMNTVVGKGINPQYFD